MPTDENRPADLVAPDLMAIVRCPRCRGTLHQEVRPEVRPEDSALRCDGCRLQFGVVDGVPNFLLEDARPFGADAG